MVAASFETPMVASRRQRELRAEMERITKWRIETEHSNPEQGAMIKQAMDVSHEDGYLHGIDAHVRIVRKKMILAAPYALLVVLVAAIFVHPVLDALVAQLGD